MHFYEKENAFSYLGFTAPYKRVKAKNVNTIENMMPPITTVARGLCTTIPVPVPVNHAFERNPTDKKIIGPTQMDKWSEDIGVSGQSILELMVNLLQYPQLDGPANPVY